jgi:hypothetical protein
MDRRMKRSILAGVAGLAIAAGAGGAVAATTKKDSERKAFLNDAAKRLNVTPDQLTKALQGAFFDRLDAAVKAGRLTQTQADAIKKRVQQGGGIPFLGGPGPGPGGPGGRFFGHRGGPFLAGLDAAAKYLGLTDAQLRDRLEAGKSLAQIAQDQSKTVDGLKDALKTAAKTKLDAAVSAKRLSSAEEQRILSDLDSHLDDLIQRKGGLRHRFDGPGRPPGPLGPPGAGGPDPPPWGPPGP